MFISIMTITDTTEYLLFQWLSFMHLSNILLQNNTYSLECKKKKRFTTWSNLVLNSIPRSYLLLDSQASSYRQHDCRQTPSERKSRGTGRSIMFQYFLVFPQTYYHTWTEQCMYPLLFLYFYVACLITHLASGLWFRFRKRKATMSLHIESSSLVDFHL